MKESLIENAAAQYGDELFGYSIIGDGLIHKTYKISFKKDRPVLLQRLNTTVFKQPEKIIENYCLLQVHLAKTSRTKIPALLTNRDGQYFWIDGENNFWRAFEFVENSFSLSKAENAAQVFAAAKCFGRFTKSLEGINTAQLNIVIPHFHDLSLRYKQFEEATSKPSPERKTDAVDLISELGSRKKLVTFYEQLDNKDYPSRVMHHDCKISNILFHSLTNEIICPVDLDTVMPGKFFSDLGDMIRTMACSVDETSRDWETILIKKENYKAILKGYLEGIENSFTIKELAHLHYAGLIMIYMQTLRFVTDFLNNDVYYQTTYKEQNLDRAKNQLILLKQLEDFLKEEYNLHLY